MDDIKFMTGYNVEPVVARRRSSTRFKYYPTGRGKEALAQLPSTTRKSALEMASRASRSCRTSSTSADVGSRGAGGDRADALAKQGRTRRCPPGQRRADVGHPEGASDIHIEPCEKSFACDRIDGILYNIMSPPMKFRDAIVSRVRSCRARHRREAAAADGRIKIRFNEAAQKEIDFRVSVLPTLFGEKIVMRLLDKDKLMLDMTKLVRPESLAKFETAILRPWGMVP
jgi:type IV pilus assembly protein PilB